MLSNSAQIIARGLTSNDPAERAAGALAFGVKALESLIKLAVDPNANPAETLGKIAFPVMDKEVLQALFEQQMKKVL